MVGIVLAIIVVLWLLGFVQLPYINSVLFSLFGHPITLYNILLFLIIIWIIEILPSPLRQIVFILFVLWLLSLFGIIAIGGFSQLIVIAIIIGLVFSLF